MSGTTWIRGAVLLTWRARAIKRQRHPRQHHQHDDEVGQPARDLQAGTSSTAEPPSDSSSDLVATGSKIGSRASMLMKKRSLSPA